MTDEQLMMLWNNEYIANKVYPKVRVQGSDYSYEGWVVTVFRKKRAPHQLRCDVEDENGRLFIHNATQLFSAPER